MCYQVVVNKCDNNSMMQTAAKMMLESLTCHLLFLKFILCNCVLKFNVVFVYANRLNICLLSFHQPLDAARRKTRARRPPDGPSNGIHMIPDLIRDPYLSKLVISISCLIGIVF